MILTALTDDVILEIILHLSGDVLDIATFAQVCSYFNALVEEFGWNIWLRQNPRERSSISKAHDRWSSGRIRVKYFTLAERYFARPQFTASPLSPPWRGRFQPTIAISSTRMCVSAGHSLFSYVFSTHSQQGHSPPVCFEGSYVFDKDITSLIFIQGAGADSTLICGFADGSLETIVINAQKGASLEIERIRDPAFQVHQGDLIEELSLSSDNLLTLSSDGYVSLLSLRSSDPKPTCIDLRTRSWTAYLSSTYAAFGTSSTSPLSVHNVTPSHISQTPSLHLTSHALSDQSERTAVYAISKPPFASPWGSSDQTITTGWYDGGVRIYDFRTPSIKNDTNTTSMLAPCLHICDPWSSEPVYSLASGGPAGSHIAAGTARHSVISFWDVRSPTSGWSVHAPGNDVSPIYKVIFETTRVFGATQSRPFVYDFGLGIDELTYPRLRRVANDGLKPPKTGLGFYVTKYSHHRSTSILFD